MCVTTVVTWRTYVKNSEMACDTIEYLRYHAAANEACCYKNTISHIAYLKQYFSWVLIAKYCKDRLLCAYCSQRIILPNEICVYVLLLHGYLGYDKEKFDWPSIKWKPHTMSYLLFSWSICELCVCIQYMREHMIWPASVWFKQESQHNPRVHSHPDNVTQGYTHRDSIVP